MHLRTLAEHALRPLVRGRPEIKSWLSLQERRLTALGHTVVEHVPVLLRPRVDNITVAVTAQCNLRCIGCRYGRDFMPGHHLSLDMVRDLLDDASKIGVRNVRLYGGEPLLHSDLPSMVEYANSVGVTPYLTTNALLLKKRIDELYQAGLRFITVGLYGTGVNYESYVQRPRTFHLVEQSVAAVRERYPDIRLRINWLLMRPSANRESLQALFNFAECYDTPIQIDLVHYSLPYFTEGPNRILQFRPEDRPLIEDLVSMLVERKKERPDLFEQSELALHSIPDWLILGPKMHVPCDKYNMIWIGADGTVQLCYVKFRLGNLHETRLCDLLMGKDHYAAARGAFRLECPNCHCGYDTRIEKHWPSRLRYRKLRGRRTS